jgi:predicted DNA-binding transcriptional regulator
VGRIDARRPARSNTKVYRDMELSAAARPVPALHVNHSQLRVVSLSAYLSICCYVSSFVSREDIDIPNDSAYHDAVESLELLRALGLSTYEAEVYRALLKVDKAKVQDLARVVAVPRPQIYVALGALLEKGLCQEIRGKVTFYSAVAPGMAFRSALRKEEELLKAKAEGVRALRAGSQGQANPPLD